MLLTRGSHGAVDILNKCPLVKVIHENFSTGPAKVSITLCAVHMHTSLVFLYESTTLRARMIVSLEYPVLVDFGLVSLARHSLMPVSATRKADLSFA